MAKTKIKGAKKILKKAYKSVNYESRGHKVYTLLKVLDNRSATAMFSFNQLNRLAFKYSRPNFKFDKVRDRGYACQTIRHYLSMGYIVKIVRGLYALTDNGRAKLNKLDRKFRE